MPETLSTGSTSLNKLVADALAMEAQSAQDAGALGFMARVLVQTTLPHRKQSGTEFVRTNGALTLTMLAPSSTGLPYGSIPRLLLAWLTTEAVRTKERKIIMGNSLSDFMRELDLVPTGGRWGSITRLKDQTKRLFAATVSCEYDTKDRHDRVNMKIASRATLWWAPKKPDQAALWQSTVTLDQDFFNEITSSPVPVDMRALKALKRSPMALDIYSWLTYRMSYLRKPTEIPWPAMQAQFGAGYPSDAKGRGNFKRAFRTHLRKIRVVYPDVDVRPGVKVLELRPSQTHIRKLSTHKR